MKKTKKNKKKVKKKNEIIVTIGDKSYLAEESPMARKLLFLKIAKYNHNAKKWGYDTCVYFEFDRRIVNFRKPLRYRQPVRDTFWCRFRTGYRNACLDDLAGQIVQEAVELNVYIKTWKRYAKLLYFYLNY
jgi:hypothetical protein